jgi:hypothetical protein
MKVLVIGKRPAHDALERKKIYTSMKGCLPTGSSLSVIVDWVNLTPLALTEILKHFDAVYIDANPQDVVGIKFVCWYDWNLWLDVIYSHPQVYPPRIIMRVTEEKSYTYLPGTRFLETPDPPDDLHYPVHLKSPISGNGHGHVNAHNRDEVKQYLHSRLICLGYPYVICQPVFKPFKETKKVKYHPEAPMGLSWARVDTVIINNEIHLNEITRIDALMSSKDMSRVGACMAKDIVETKRTTSKLDKWREHKFLFNHSMRFSVKILEI